MTHNDKTDQMAALYEAALDTEVTLRAVNWIARAYLLLEIADDNTDTAKAVVHTAAGHTAALREYNSLSDHDRDELTSTTTLHWSLCLKRTVQRVYHACEVLDIDPTTLNAEHLAIHAATLLSTSPTDLAAEIKAAGS